MAPHAVALVRSKWRCGPCPSRYVKTPIDRSARSCWVGLRDYVLGVLSAYAELRQGRGVPFHDDVFVAPRCGDPHHPVPIHRHHSFSAQKPRPSRHREAVPQRLRNAPARLLHPQLLRGGVGADGHLLIGTVRCQCIDAAPSACRRPLCLKRFLRSTCFRAEGPGELDCPLPGEPLPCGKHRVL